jgi:tight adherence protein C
MSRVLVVTAASAWLGLTLLLAEVRWFRRPLLVDRLLPYAPGGMAHGPHRAGRSLGPLRDVVAPLAQSVGSWLTRLFGVSEELSIKLRRIHSPLTVPGFRVRQLGWATAAFGLASVVVVATAVPAGVGILLVLGSPLLVFLVLEQQVHRASAHWQRRLFLELPVISEQLGMLLGAGYSLGGALNRLAARSRGACATDLGIACSRIRQGLSDRDALQEWAAIAGVDAVDRLVHVLTLNRDAGDLGGLISEEAQSIRAEVHRQLVATIDKRSEQVWIPVTVATLLPGVIFLAVPFIEALRLFTNG